MYGDLTVDFAQRRVTLGGQPVPLVSLENRLVAELAANAGQVLTYERLLERVWGKKGDGDLRTHARRSGQAAPPAGRRRRTPTYVFNEPRVGYWVPRSEAEKAAE